jgi:hypothetical protein
MACNFVNNAYKRVEFQEYGDVFIIRIDNYAQFKPEEFADINKVDLILY